MTSSWQAPKYAHIGPCQNVIMAKPSTWEGAVSCGKPTIALGGEFPLDRDLCQDCSERGKRFRDRLFESYARNIVSDDARCAEWIADAWARVVDADIYMSQRARANAPMRELRQLRADRERLLECIRSVEAARMSPIK